MTKRFVLLFLFLLPSISFGGSVIFDDFIKKTKSRCEIAHVEVQKITTDQRVIALLDEVCRDVASIGFESLIDKDLENTPKNINNEEK